MPSQSDSDETLAEEIEETVLPKRITSSKMGYGWTSEAHVLMSQEWAQYRDICAFHGQAVATDFTRQAQREQLMDTYSSMNKEAPFGETRRFPAYAAYAKLTGSKIGDAVHKVVALLHQSDRAKNVAVGAGSGDAIFNRVKFQADQDAKQNFYHAVKNLGDLLTSKKSVESMQTVGIYNQANFETYYELKWTP